jgi:ribosomal protein L35
VYHRSNSAHLLSGKSGKRLRRLRKPGVLAQVFADRLVIALGKHGA